MILTDYARFGFTFCLRVYIAFVDCYLVTVVALVWLLFVVGGLMFDVVDFVVCG